MYLRSALRAVLVFAIVIAVVVLVLARPLAELTCPQHVEQATSYLRVLALFVRSPVVNRRCCLRRVASVRCGPIP